MRWPHVRDMTQAFRLKAVRLKVGAQRSGRFSLQSLPEVFNLNPFSLRAFGLQSVPLVFILFPDLTSRQQDRVVAAVLKSVAVTSSSVSS